LSEERLVTLGERLRIAREDAGMKQEELANMIDCDKTTISKYETNNRTPDPTTLTRIANVTGVSLDWLMGRTENKAGIVSEARARYLTPTGDPRRDLTRRELLGMLLRAGKNASPERLHALAILAESASRDKKGDPST